MCKVKFKFECTPGCSFKSHINFCIFADTEIGCSNVLARQKALESLKKHASHLDGVRSITKGLSKCQTSTDTNRQLH